MTGGILYRGISILIRMYIDDRFIVFWAHAAVHDRMVEGHDFRARFLILSQL